MRPIAIGLALSAIAIAGCGDGDSTDSAASVSVVLKQELPSSPIADEGISTGISLTDADGNEVYSKDFWKLPRGRPNEAMGTTNYDLDETDLGPPGVYEIDAVIRACNASGCSAGNLGSPVVHCRTNLGIDVDRQITVVYKDREKTAGCVFAVQSP